LGGHVAFMAFDWLKRMSFVRQSHETDDVS
jgi:hypothetical protein